jgi:hypothetical protein
LINRAKYTAVDENDGKMLGRKNKRRFKKEKDKKETNACKMTSNT